MSTPAAYLHEIFSAIQGEGPLVGVRQIFLRFCECNLSCRFCDTPASRGHSETCRIEKTAGERDFVTVPNPLDVKCLVEALTRLNKSPHHSISLTGGEPLLQADFLVEALPLLRAQLPVYLETNGTLPEALGKVLPQVDIIAMDIKLPSAAGVDDQLTIHKEFLSMSVGRGPCPPPHGRRLFIKIVITADTREEELLEAFSLVAEVDPQIEVILQPVSEISPKAKAPTPQQCLRWQTMGLQRLASVRVIPQMHRLMGQM